MKNSPTAELTEKELRMAYIIWHKYYNFNYVDDEMHPYLNTDIKAASENKSKAWLEKTRKALFLSAQSVADALSITRPAYSQLELSEKNGTITLESLTKAAEAMNCELVYAIRPINKKLHSHQIWKKLLTKAVGHSWLKNCDQKKRGPALARIALETMNSSEFRKEQCWSKKANQPNQPI